MDEKLVALYHRHVASALDRQRRFADFLEQQAPGADWHYTVSEAALTFGEELRFEAPLLGTFAEGDETWLWAWNNRSLGLPAVTGDLAVRVREFGRAEGIEAFTAT